MTSPSKPSRHLLSSSPSRDPLSNLSGHLNTLNLALGSPVKGAASKDPFKQSLKRSGVSSSARSRPSSPTKSAKSSPRKEGSSKNRTALGTKDVSGGYLRGDVVSKDWDPSLLGDKKVRAQKSMDRFIPNREATSSGSAALQHGDSNPSTSTSISSEMSYDSSQHTSELSASLGLELNRRILAFSAEPPSSINDNAAKFAALNKAPKSSTAASQRRRVATTPFKVLDAPGQMNDYYLNLLDWSVSNKVAIGLHEAVYLWDPKTAETTLLCDVSALAGASADAATEEYVSSIRFSEDGAFVAMGTHSGPVHIYDVEAGRKVRTMAGHTCRVPTLSWSGGILCSGNREGWIMKSDVRISQHKLDFWGAHGNEVCGLEWRPEIEGGLSGGGQGLLASGGNDNVVQVWDGRMLSAPKMTKTNHTAAVKGLAWCPWSPSTLATGGGSNDKTIHIWNTTTSARTHSLETSAQVTSLIFNPYGKELLATGGFPDKNISIYSYPSLTRIAEIPSAHESRIICSALSPDGCTVATLGGEELKFWNVFDAPKGRGKGVGGQDARQEDAIGKRGKGGLSVR